MARRTHPRDRSVLTHPNLVFQQGPEEYAGDVSGLMETPNNIRTVHATFSDIGSASRWSEEHGTGLSGKAMEGLASYLRKGWKISSVLIEPTTSDGYLSGNIGPVAVTLKAGSPIVPLVGIAGIPDVPPARIVTAVLAPHRVESKSAGIEQAAVTEVYGGWIAPTHGKGDPLSATADRRMFLTVFDNQVGSAQPVQDPVFRFAPDDQTYREQVGAWVAPGSIVAITGAGLAFIVGVLALIFFLRRGSGRRREVDDGIEILSR